MASSFDLILRQQYAADFSQFEDNKLSKDFKGWITGEEFILDSVINPDSFKIHIKNKDSYCSSLAYEIVKLSCACFETVANIQEPMNAPKSLAWSAIKSYYAAYYAAHSIMRCFGFTANSLEKGHLTYFNDQAKLLGLNNINENRGFYLGIYDTNNQYLTLKKYEKSHEDTWKCFTDCLDSLSMSVLSTTGLTADKQSLSTFLSDLSYDLKRANRFSKGNWLSYMRNEINYRQEFKVWFPYSRDSFKYKDMRRILDLWKSDNLLVGKSAAYKNDIEDFFLISTKVINFSKVLNADLVELSPKQNCLFKKYSKRLVKEIMAA